MKQSVLVFVVWLSLSMLAMAFASLPVDSVVIDGRFLPFGNDSFYHARRILDAVGERGFFQFDVTMHVPEGSWVSWPWGYDLLMAGALQLAMAFDSSMDAMKFLAYVPVVWTAVNAALLLAIARVTRLPFFYQALALLGFALLPLTQKLHGIGRIDHHYMELTFVLLVSWTLLRWLRGPSSSRAIACGLALAVAPAFHHALFILQLPVLLTLLILWAQKQALPARQLRIAAVAFLSATVLVLAGSEPFWDGQFSMATLSWFHGYIAVLSAGIMVFTAWREVDRRQLGLLAIGALLAAMPLLAQMMLAGQFLSGALFTSTAILEVTSPVQMMLGGWGLGGTLSLYSGLLLLVPLVMVLLLPRLFRPTDSMDTGFAVAALFGLALLLVQYRLNYFGLPFLLLGPFYLLSRWQHQENWPGKPLALAAVVVMALSLRPALSGGLLERYPLAGDHLYETVQPLMAPLHDACASTPGTVIAANQFGHYITYHSNCSVIANNFLLTALHFRKVEEVNALFHLAPGELRSRLKKPAYLLAYLGGVFEMQDGKVVVRDLDDVRSRNPALIAKLFFATGDPEGFTLIDEVRLNVDLRPQPVLARLYRIDPVAR